MNGFQETVISSLRRAFAELLAMVKCDCEIVVSENLVHGMAV